MADTATETAPRHKRGGLYFEGFVVGSLTEHRYHRTVTQMDNMLFSNMTLNPQPLHIDRHFCETETEWGQQHQTRQTIALHKISCRCSWTNN